MLGFTKYPSMWSGYLFGLPRPHIIPEARIGQNDRSGFWDRSIRDYLGFRSPGIPPVLRFRLLLSPRVGST